MTFRFPVVLAQAIEDQARATGRGRTTVVAEALSQIFGLSLSAKALVKPYLTACLDPQASLLERILATSTDPVFVVSELSRQLRMDGQSRLEHSLRHKDGTDRPVEIHSRLIESGDQLAIQSFIRELSHVTSLDVDHSQ